MKSLFYIIIIGTLSLGLHAQEKTIDAPKALKLDGVPAISSKVAQDTARYTNFRRAVFQDWHPVERGMLITTRFEQTNQLHLIDEPKGAREQLTFFDEPVAAATFHPRDGEYAVFSKDVGGSEQYQLFRYDFQTGESTLLTDGKSRYQMGPWSTQGDTLSYMSNQRTGQDTDLWLMDPQEDRGRLLLELKGGGWSALDWNSSDTTILLHEYVSVNESYLWLVDVRARSKKALTPRDAKEQIAYLGGKFSKDGKGVFVRTDKDSEFLRLAYVDLATLEHRYLTTDIPWDVSEFDLSKDGKLIAFAVNEGGTSSLWVYEVVSGESYRYEDVPAGVMSRLSWHNNGLELAFTFSNTQIAGDVYTLKFAKDKFKRWTYSESAIKTDNFSAAEQIQWESFDKKTISGFLYRAPSKFTGKRPVLIDIHGGPEAQSRPTFLGSVNYWINELGITVIAPNVRGSTGFGKTFTKLDNSTLREDSYKDLNALIDWIATRPDLDASRVCVMGGSYGGHMTLAAAAFYNDKIACAIDIVGMSNLVTFLENTESYRRDLRRVEYGDERDPAVREFLERIAPMKHLDKMKKPMFIVQGKNDPRVPLSESDQLVDGLKKQGTPVWYMMAEDEGHGFAKKANQDFLSYALVEFLKRNLVANP